MVAGSTATSASPNRFATAVAACFRPGSRRVVVDGRVEVVERRRVRRPAVRRHDDLVAAARELVTRGRRRPGHAVAVEDEQRRLLRGRSGRLDLAPEGDGGRLRRRRDVGRRELADGVLEVRVRRRDAGVAGQPLDLRLEEVARGQAVGEERVREHRLAGEPVAAGPDLDVLRDRADDAGQLERREVVLDLLLQRLHEHLLADHAVEVRVGVPEADEAERVVAVQPLVPRVEVDVRVVRRGAARVLVVVTAIDVHPDAAELVHDLLEAVEVDRDQVVDRQPGQVLHRLEGAARAALGVGGVDLAAERRLSGARDVDDHVAREREHRDRLRLGVCAQQHHRVGARRRALPVAHAMVVAGDQRDRGLPGQRDREPLLRDLHVGRVGGDGLHLAVEVEVGPTRESGAEDEDRGEHPEQDPAGPAEGGPRRRLRLPVARHGRDCGGREGRRPVPVPVARDSAPADSSFQRGPHRKMGARKAPAGRRIPGSPAGGRGHLYEPRRRAIARASFCSKAAGYGFPTLNMIVATFARPAPSSTRSRYSLTEAAAAHPRAPLRSRGGRRPSRGATFGNASLPLARAGDRRSGRRALRDQLGEALEHRRPDDAGSSSALAWARVSEDADGREDLRVAVRAR